MKRLIITYPLHDSVRPKCPSFHSAQQHLCVQPLLYKTLGFSLSLSLLHRSMAILGMSAQTSGSTGYSNRNPCMFDDMSNIPLQSSFLASGIILIGIISNHPTHRHHPETRHTHHRNHHTHPGCRRSMLLYHDRPDQRRIYRIWKCYHAMHRHGYSVHSCYTCSDVSHSIFLQIISCFCSLSTNTYVQRSSYSFQSQGGHSHSRCISLLMRRMAKRFFLPIQER